MLLWSTSLLAASAAAATADGPPPPPNRLPPRFSVRVRGLLRLSYNADDDPSPTHPTYYDVSLLWKQDTSSPETGARARLDTDTHVDVGDPYAAFARFVTLAPLMEVQINNINK